MDKFNIDIPDDLEIKNQINLILDKGIGTRESFYSYLKKMYRDIGFTNLFHDKAEIIFIGILLVSLLIYGVFAIKNDYMITKERIYTSIFIASPLYYLMTNIFSFINLKENNTFEIEMVCKYNLYQLSALRMLIFSIISIILSSIFILGLHNKINTFRGMMISLSSIFLFASLLLYSIVKMKSKIVKFIVVGGWLICNGALLKLSANQYFEFLQTIPIVVYVLVIGVSVCFYMKNIRILSNYNRVGAIT